MREFRVEAALVTIWMQYLNWLQVLQNCKCYSRRPIKFSVSGAFCFMNHLRRSIRTNTQQLWSKPHQGNGTVCKAQKQSHWGPAGGH